MDARPFAHELALLPELPQREAKVCVRLRELPVEAAVELLHDLIRLAAAAEDDARVALLVCVGLQRYEKTLGYEWLAQLYVSADERGYDDVKGLLATSQVARRPGKGGPVENQFVEKTFGERKALARGTRDRDLLDRLMFDRNPEVIRMLITNPRIIERDVVKIAAMRPTTPTALYVILRSPKWSPNYRVKKALALNPYLPVNDAISLLPFLTRQDLDEVANGIEVHERVASSAREMVGRRDPDAGPESN